MTGRVIALRYPGTCSSCGTSLAAGIRAHWDGKAKTATCLQCRPVDAKQDHDAVAKEVARPESDASGTATSVATGTAGASARREYERRAARERAKKEARIIDDAEWRRQVKTEHPLIGRVAAALTPKPVMTPESQLTRNWGVGAVGEERLGTMLDASAGGIVLHDRRIPNSKANIDHIVVAPAGVFIIDAKRYAGQVQRRDYGSVFRHDIRLFVGRRDCSKLVAGVLWQAAETRKVMAPEASHIPIYGALCFVDAEWSLFSRPLYIDGVFVGWPKALQKFVGQKGSLSDAVIESTARQIAQGLRPA